MLRQWLGLLNDANLFQLAETITPGLLLKSIRLIAIRSLLPTSHLKKGEEKTKAYPDNQLEPVSDLSLYIYFYR